MKRMITRSTGLPAGVGSWIVGGGYSGITEELDKIVREEADVLSKAFDRDAEIRFNSDRRSGGAWLKDKLEGFKGNTQVGLSAHIYPTPPKSMTRQEWYKSLADKLGWGKEMDTAINNAPKGLFIETYLSGDVVLNPVILNSGNEGSRYASYEFESIEDGLRFLLDNTDFTKLNPC